MAGGLFPYDPLAGIIGPSNSAAIPAPPAVPAVPTLNGTPMTPPGTTSPSWLQQVGNFFGAVPGPTGQGGSGFLGGLTNFLTNPLTEAAANAYFTGISQPRNTNFWGRLGKGGLAGMQTLAATQSPLAQAQLAQLQGANQEQALRTKVLSRQAMPVPQASIDRLRQAAQTFSSAAVSGLNPDGSKMTPEQQQMDQWNAVWMNNLADGAQMGGYDVESFNTALEHYDQAKQYNQVMQGYAKGMAGFTQQEMLDYFKAHKDEILGTGGAAGTIPPGPGSPGVAEPASKGLPANTHMPPAMISDLHALSAYGISVEPDFSTGSNVRANPAGGWEYSDGSRWYSIDAGGNVNIVG